MLDTLQKMSGTTHKVYRDGKSVTRDMEKLILQNEGKVTINLSVKEQPVISYNDMAFMPMCNSIVFRAGDSPIWNRNATCLPMSWRLFKNTIEQPGKKYSLQTVPTLSSALDFDVRKNMPDFLAMWEKRRKQALEVEATQKAYAEAYHFNETDIARLDPDKYADEIMQFVNAKLGAFDTKTDEELAEKSDADAGSYYRDDRMDAAKMKYEQNRAVVEAQKESAAADERWKMPIYCGGLLSRDDLCPLPSRVPNKQWDEILVNLFIQLHDEMMSDIDNFYVTREGALNDPRGKVLIQKYTPEELELEKNAIDEERAAAFAKKGIVFTEEEKFEGTVRDAYRVTEEFYRYLVSFDSWKHLAGGKFESAFADILKGADLMDS